MTTPADANTPGWVRVGARACGLVLDGRIVALVYWEGPRAASVDQPDTHRAATDPGFWCLPTDRPSEPMRLLETPEPAAADWAHARELAARVYFGQTVPQTTTGQAGRATRCETDDTAELRREAADLLRRSPRWQRALLREELSRRRWHGPSRSG